MTTYNLTLHVHRYDPDEGKSWVQTYSIEAGGIMRFVDVFRKINETLDPTLVWGSSCEHGQCGTCSMKINGKPLLACELLVENAIAEFDTRVFNVKPLDVAPVIRDLVVDIEKAYDRVERIKPYIINPTPPPSDNQEHLVEPKSLERYAEATRCINCFCCASACFTQSQKLFGAQCHVGDHRQGHGSQGAGGGGAIGVFVRS